MSRDQLIVALDTRNVNQASHIVKCLEGSVNFYKIGLELAMNGGLDFAKELACSNYRVFLDMKLLDIENTVRKAVSNIADSGITFLSVHGMDSKTLNAAMQGAKGSDLKILSITVLTNLTRNDLVEQGLRENSSTKVVAYRSEIAHRTGCHGAVSSGIEASIIRKLTNPNFIIVTPGIRLPGNLMDDQERITTPQTALLNGANYIVVGRPITQAKDIKASAENFLKIIN
ncbi:MAG: Orotidine 5'-phosphate decarboxylase [Hyphomicrobiaceae bacterium hypho_1]